jgi:DNA-binding NtrC family response regulator
MTVAPRRKLPSRYATTYHSRVATVVVLDDDESIVALLRTIVVDAGHTAVTGRALSEIPLGTRADLVITDLIPVRPYTADAARNWIAEIRERFGGAVIVVTAHRGAAGDRETLGADDVVAKPFDVDQILEAMDRLLR